MLLSFPKVGLVSFKIKGLNSIWLWYSLVYLNLSLKFLTNGIPTDESLIPQESWNYPEAPNDWTIKFYLWKKILCRYDAALCLGQVTHWILLINFKRSRRVSRSKSRSQSQDHSNSLALYRRMIPNWTLTGYDIYDEKLSNTNEKIFCTMLEKFACNLRNVSDESLGRDETPRHTSHDIFSQISCNFLL